MLLKHNKSVNQFSKLMRMSSANFSSKPQKMYASEAFVETLQAKGVTDVFGIVGSAFMDPLDIMPASGIRFIPC